MPLYIHHLRNKPENNLLKLFNFPVCPGPNFWGSRGQISGLGDVENGIRVCRDFNLSQPILDGKLDGEPVNFALRIIQNQFLVLLNIYVLYSFNLPVAFSLIHLKVNSISSILLNIAGVSKSYLLPYFLSSPPLLKFSNKINEYFWQQSALARTKYVIFVIFI